MADQLHDLMTRLADEAGPGPMDPTLWKRARRSRRRDQRLVASAGAAAVLALVAGTLAGMAALSDPAPPVDRPGIVEQEAGIPSEVHDVAGGGGLRLERDLAVGRGSVAIATATAEIVVTADDGAYHRLALPGFDPALYDAGGPDASGLSLSPDGTRLAYGWRAPRSLESTASGVRILDLVTGKVTTLPRQALYDDPARLVQVTWGFSWSPDGRHIHNRVKTMPAGGSNAWVASSCWYARVDATRGTARVNTERLAGGYEPGDDLSNRVPLASNGDVAVIGTDGPDRWHRSSEMELPGDDSWLTGRFDASSRRLRLEHNAVGASLLLATTQGRPPIGYEKPATTVLKVTGDQWPDGARIRLLDWVGDRHALAMVHRPADGGAWEPDADLVMFALDKAAGRAEGTVVGHVAVGDSNSAFSFATHLATVDAPTRDFDEQPRGGEEGAQGNSASAPAQSGSFGGLQPLGVAVGGLAFVVLVVGVIRRQLRRQQPETGNQHRRVRQKEREGDDPTTRQSSRVGRGFCSDGRPASRVRRTAPRQATSWVGPVGLEPTTRGSSDAHPSIREMPLFVRRFGQSTCWRHVVVWGCSRATFTTL